MYLHGVHLKVLFIVAAGHLQVGVVAGRPELVASEHEEDECSRLLEQFLDPLVAERHRDLDTGYAEDLVREGVGERGRGEMKGGRGRARERGGREREEGERERRERECEGEGRGERGEGVWSPP
jgi:hypothetical protein